MNPFEREWRKDTLIRIHDRREHTLIGLRTTAFFSLLASNSNRASVQILLQKYPIQHCHSRL
jgi:hypothetical protein